MVARCPAVIIPTATVPFPPADCPRRWQAQLNGTAAAPRQGRDQSDAASVEHAISAISFGRSVTARALVPTVSVSFEGVTSDFLGYLSTDMR